LTKAKKEEEEEGYCYAATNVCLPGLVKIGFTRKLVSKRMKQLSGTSVPDPFIVIACIACANPQAVEKQIHRHFRAYAYKKEFFRVSEAAVINHFASLV